MTDVWKREHHSFLQMKVLARLKKNQTFQVCLKRRFFEMTMMVTFLFFLPHKYSLGEGRKCEGSNGVLSSQVCKDISLYSQFRGGFCLSTSSQEHLSSSRLKLILHPSCSTVPTLFWLSVFVKTHTFFAMSVGVCTWACVVAWFTGCMWVCRRTSWKSPSSSIWSERMTAWASLLTAPVSVLLINS